MEQYPKRKRNRIEDFDYSQDGVYFITILTANRLHILWDSVRADIIRPDRVPLSDIGRLVEQAILQISGHYNGVTVDKYCIMPDHVHLLLRIEREDDGWEAMGAPAASGRMISALTAPTVNVRQVAALTRGAAPSIPVVVGSLKRWVSRQVGTSIWHKSFYDHCIRNQKDYDETWQYIEQNPLKYKLGYRRGCGTGG